jgi:hypothetical protein
VIRPPLGLLPGCGLPVPGAGWAVVPGETGVPGGVDDGAGCRVAPALGCTGLALLTCAAFVLQKSISPLVGVAAKAAPERIPIARISVPISLPCLMVPSIGQADYSEIART